jgi:hypothetical protein
MALVSFPDNPLEIERDSLLALKADYRKNRNLPVPAVVRSSLLHWLDVLLPFQQSPYLLCSEKFALGHSVCLVQHGMIHSFHILAEMVVVILIFLAEEYPPVYLLFQIHVGVEMP